MLTQKKCLNHEIQTFDVLFQRKDEEGSEISLQWTLHPLFKQDCTVKEFLSNSTDYYQSHLHRIGCCTLVLPFIVVVYSSTNLEPINSSLYLIDSKNGLGNNALHSTRQSQGEGH